MIIFCLNFLPKEFQSKCYLHKHMKRHQNVKNAYKCMICNSEFLSANSLSAHEKTHPTYKWKFAKKRRIKPTNQPAVAAAAPPPQPPPLQQLPITRTAIINTATTSGAVVAALSFSPTNNVQHHQQQQHHPHQQMIFDMQHHKRM